MYGHKIFLLIFGAGNWLFPVLFLIYPCKLWLWASGWECREGSWENSVLDSPVPGWIQTFFCAIFPCKTQGLARGVWFFITLMGSLFQIHFGLISIEMLETQQQLCIFSKEIQARSPDWFQSLTAAALYFSFLPAEKQVKLGKLIGKIKWIKIVFPFPSSSMNSPLRLDYLWRRHHSMRSPWRCCNSETSSWGSLPSLLPLILGECGILEQPDTC